MKTPFNLPKPDYVLNDNAPHNKYDKNKFMGVWKIKKIKNKLFK